MEQQEFQFPDEIEKAETSVEVKANDIESEIDIEIEDDRPVEDREKTPMPKELVEKLEVDELDKYSAEAKEKLIQMKKVWHDERRAKEEAAREREEAISLAKKVMEENKRFKTMLTTGEKEYVETLQNAADLELKMAKKAYKEAYDAGDVDALVEAQQAMQQANLKIVQAKNFKLPPLQETDYEVQIPQERVEAAPNRDLKAEAWRERNDWFGQDEEMTAAVLGLHEKLKRTGVAIGSDEYYATLDKTMRKRFPENFDEPEEVKPKAEPARTKPSTVVAPATRSTASNKVKLSRSQVLLSKKLGLTPEQYALELKKLEAQNG